VSEINPQEFGRLQAQVETLIVSDARKTELLETMSESIAAIQLQLAEAKGGWRLLVAIGGAAGSLGAGVAWAISHFRITP
jgi:hypothetical protein